MNLDLMEEGIGRFRVNIFVQPNEVGMKTFDNALFQLYRDGKISMEEALKNADSENNLRLKISLSESERGEGVSDEEATGGLSLSPKLEED